MGSLANRGSVTWGHWRTMAEGVIVGPGGVSHGLENLETSLGLGVAAYFFHLNLIAKFYVYI